MTKTALVVIDVQNDFLEGGSLGVDGSLPIVPLINEIRKNPLFSEIIFTQDWHPKGHVSFASAHPGHKPMDVITLPDGTEQTLWPDHCVQDSEGAAFPANLVVLPTDYIVHKGTNKDVDSYSAFFDNKRIHKTSLEDYLHKKGITTLYFCGLCLDFCVFYSAMDSHSVGFKTYCILDACGSIGAESAAKAKEDMKGSSIILLNSSEIPQ
ncbi:putative bifunctional nicotinamidase/pyrazinamidase [Blattamonas nauphoetae]|uniref:nicotinamidase n=1 Tax=Blattamonas nauphoetae TaxID=2049346 RepID=A0ABQ9XQ39_9EUKA|nr:putative bifunctional nicotinamidase/pyrazinamidase [Blattamonas nauphoetae]